MEPRSVTVRVKVARDGKVYFGAAHAGHVKRCPDQGPPGKPWGAYAFRKIRYSRRRFVAIDGDRVTWHRLRSEAIDAVVEGAS